MASRQGSRHPRERLTQEGKGHEPLPSPIRPYLLEHGLARLESLVRLLVSWLARRWLSAVSPCTSPASTSRSVAERSPLARSPSTSASLPAYDPCCGSGGMLTITKDHVTRRLAPERRHPPVPHQPGGRDPPLRPGGEPGDLGGVQVRPLHQGPTGATPTASPSAAPSRTTATPGCASTTCSPIRPTARTGSATRRPCGPTHARGDAGRFGPGLPRISDGQLLFLLHMLGRMQGPRRTAARRIAIIMNGSPLFTGDAGSGESEIRRWILENDWLEAIDRPARAALLQHRHRHLRLGADQPQGRRTQGQGAAHRRHRLLDADAQEPGRQAPRDPLDRAQDIVKIVADFEDGDTRTIDRDGRKEDVASARSSPRPTSATARSRSSARCA